MMRHLLIEAMLLCAPLLIAAALVSLSVSLLQTLTSVQEQTLTAVPRLLAVFTVTMVTMPWMLHRLTAYTLRLFNDLHVFLG
jgi:flagellar biosynthetic protein FliQ